MFYLISDYPLPIVENNPEYPQLMVQAVLEDMSAPNRIRKLIPQAKYIYDITPNGLCGCYFNYVSPEKLEEEINDYLDYLGDNQKINEWFTKQYPHVDAFKQSERLFWQECHDAVISFGHYLRNHINIAKMMVYMSWCGDEGQPIILEEPITPEFFAGESCDLWLENSLYQICSQI